MVLGVLVRFAARVVGPGLRLIAKLFFRRALTGFRGEWETQSFRPSGEESARSAHAFPVYVVAGVLLQKAPRHGSAPRAGCGVICLSVFVYLAGFPLPMLRCAHSMHARARACAAVLLLRRPDK